MSKASQGLTLVCAVVFLVSCDAWNGGEVGINAPPPAPQAWSGVVQFGTTAADSVSGVTVDSSGSVYTASMENQVAVVRKYSSSGSLSWTATIGTGVGVFVKSIAVSPNALYVAGSTSVVLDNTGLGMGGGVDGFVVKYSLAGARTGVLQIRESVGATDPRGVAVDTSDGVYLGGSIDSQQSFVAKYDWSGASPSQSWITRYGAAGDRYGVFGVALGNGLLHVVGPTSAPPTSGFYIARFSTTTGIQSGSTILGNVSGGNDDAFAVAADSLNNTYVAGGTDNNFGGVNAGGEDVIAAKYDAAGNNVWRYQIGSARSETANSITLSGSSVYIAGTTGAQFGGQLNKDPGLSTSDAFLIKLPNSTTGPAVTADWVRMYGSTNGASLSFNDQASGVSADPSGNVFLVGQAVGFMETSSVLLGNGDGFVMKVSTTGVLQ